MKKSKLAMATKYQIRAWPAEHPDRTTYTSRLQVRKAWVAGYSAAQRDAKRARGRK